MSDKYCITSNNLSRYVKDANVEAPIFGPSVKLAKDMESREIDALIRTFQAPVRREEVLAAFSLDKGKMGYLLTRDSAYGKGKKDLFHFRFDSIDHLVAVGADMVIVNPNHKRISIRVGKHAKHIANTLSVIRSRMKVEAGSIEYREEQARKEAEEKAKNAKISAFRRSDETDEFDLDLDMIMVYVEEQDRRAAAQVALESALVLCLSREKYLVNDSPFIKNLAPLLTEDGLDLWSLGEWVRLAEECTHPRAPYLRWLLEGTLPCHLIEAGPLFLGLQKHWDGDLDGAHEAFARAVLAGDREAMLCYAYSLCNDCGTVDDLMKAEGLIRQYRNTPPNPLSADASVKSEPILLDETVKKQKENSQVYEQFVSTYNAVMRFYAQGLEYKKKGDQGWAARNFESAHRFAPTWPELTYEYGMALQHQEEHAGKQLVYDAADAGYPPAIRTLTKFWRPSMVEKRTCEPYCRFLKMLLRIDPSEAKYQAQEYRNKMMCRTKAILELPSIDRGSWTAIKAIPIIPYERKAWVEKIRAGDRIRFAGDTYTVLERQGNRLFLLCDEVYPHYRYHKEKHDVTWQDCDLRKELNADFIAKHLSRDEQALLVTVTNQNRRYFCGSRRDPETQDRVFILSEEEARRYFGMRSYYTANKLHDYVDDLGRANAVESLLSDSELWLDPVTKEFTYLLRTRSDEADRVLAIHNGRIDPYEVAVDTSVGVRPAMWIRVE